MPTFEENTYIIANESFKKEMKAVLAQMVRSCVHDKTQKLCSTCMATLRSSCLTPSTKYPCHVLPIEEIINGLTPFFL